MFKKLFHPDMTSSGLIPPKSSNAWPERSSTFNHEIWDADVTPTLPPTLEERIAAARQEAMVYLQDPDADNYNLSAILRIKYEISPENASRAVLEAQAEISEQGSKETT
jgi:hypothetical protein